MKQTAIRGYVVAVLATGVATLLRLGLDPWLGLGRAVFGVLFTAVVVVGWHAGLRPALVTLALGTLVSSYLFLPPKYGLIPTDPRDIANLALFLGLGTCCALVAGSAHRSGRRVSAQRALLEASEARFRRIADASPQFIWITDGAGRLEFVNERWVRFSGLDLAASADWERLAAAFHPDDLALCEERWRQAVADGTNFELEARLRSAEGHFRWFLMRAVPEKDANGRPTEWFGTSTDIDDRKRAEADTRFLLELSERIRTATDAEELLAAVAVMVGRHLGASRCYFLEVDEAADRWSVRRDYVAHPQLPSLAGEYPVSAYPPAHMSALRAGHVVTIEDAVTDPVTAPFAESAYLPLGIRSCAVVPLQRRGVWVSSLALNHDAPRAWRTEELALLATAGERTWEAAEKLRLDVRLRESTALLQLVNSLTPVLLYAKDRARRLTMVNPATVRLLGKSEAELLGKDAPEYIDDPAAAAAIQANDDEIMRSGVTQTFEEIVPQADGIRVYLSAKSPLRDAAGKVVGLIGVSADITDRKSAEEALRRSEAAERVARRQLLTALEGARMVAWEWEFATGRSDRFGPVREVLGLDGDRAIDFLQHVHPDDRERVQTETMRAARGEGQYDLEFRFVRPDGRTIWVHDSATLVRDPDGRPERLSGVVTDVTARREAEAALRASEEQLRFVADHAPVLIVHCDAAGRFRFVNEAYAEYAGLAREDVLGRHVADVVGDAAWREIRPHVERALAGERVEFEEEVHYHGRRGARWVHALYSPQRDATGHVSGFVGVIQDVTTRHRADLALRQADRMEAVGRLAGGVAHEANNQMTVVLGCAAFALRNPHLPAEVRQELQQIRQAAERTAGITSQLLAFSRRQMLRPEPLDLNGVIEALAPILARTLGESGALALELSPEVGPVLADRGQVEQVLVNLTFNARDAMPAGGRLTIGTAAVTLAAPQPGSSPGEPLPAGRYGVLTVRDTGHGMGPDTLARAFEPFFTTKPLGQGTGLGLSTVYGIVRQLGGDIVVQSELGVGTVFRIYLPAASIGAPAGGGNGATPPVPTAGGTVLLVEDEPAVRQLAARSLEAAGFTVLQARHGGEALEVLARAGTAVRAVVSDVAMPVMSGGELRERLARLHPSLPVLLISGHAEDELLRRGLVGESSGLLSKPFAPEELAARVRAMVERA